jgi:hypothetical protein
MCASQAGSGSVVRQRGTSAATALERSPLSSRRLAIEAAQPARGEGCHQCTQAGVCCRLSAMHLGIRRLRGVHALFGSGRRKACAHKRLPAHRRVSPRQPMPPQFEGVGCSCRRAGRKCQSCAHTRAALCTCLVKQCECLCCPACNRLWPRLRRAPDTLSLHQPTTLRIPEGPLLGARAVAPPGTPAQAHSAWLRTTDTSCAACAHFLRRARCFPRPPSATKRPPLLRKRRPRFIPRRAACAPA